MNWNHEYITENEARLRIMQCRQRRRFLELPGQTLEQRMRNDFEFWAEQCVKIRHKQTGQMVPFVLNGAQRKVLRVLESQRCTSRPIRAIVLKARQWGCSTLIAYYMAWLQLMHLESWHSAVCTHCMNSAIMIRSLYNDLILNYPEEFRPEGMKFKRCAPGASAYELTPSRALVSAVSAKNPDALRGMAISMAHLSEVAYWPDSRAYSPYDVVRAIASNVPRTPGTVVVMESTANGAGGFFHAEWNRAMAGESDKVAVFAPWYEVEMNTENLDCEPEEFWTRLDDYERSLWNLGLTLEQINWYHNKTREVGSRIMMMREYPTTPEEAFSNEQPGVFPPQVLDAQKANILQPSRKAEVSPTDGRISDDANGRLEVWAEPCAPTELTGRSSYVAAVDVGGNWEGADWSVIAVFDCRDPQRMELVAQWRGHVDVDRLCTIAEALGRRYHNALLVVESNSLEARGLDALERIARSGYSNIFRRISYDKVTGQPSERFGFHTNAQTKAAAITDLTAALRDGRFIERSDIALAELRNYIRTRRGSMEAAPGGNDDMVMTRAIAAYALRQHRPRKNTRRLKYYS